MYERVVINVRVIGTIMSQFLEGKKEFTIIQRETIDGENHYTGLLDDGTKCEATYNNGCWIAHDMEKIFES